VNPSVISSPLDILCGKSSGLVLESVFVSGEELEIAELVMIGVLVSVMNLLASGDRPEGVFPHCSTEEFTPAVFPSAPSPVFSAVV
jgi:hypothetical protein